MGLIWMDPQSGSRLSSWKSFYSFYSNLNFRIMDLANGKSRLDILKDMVASYDRVPRDPFLQSCYFEKLLFNYSWEKTFYPEESWTNWDHFSIIFTNCFDRSSQDLVLCEKYGRLLASEGQIIQSRVMLEKALVLSPQNPLLLYEIKQLDWGKSSSDDKKLKDVQD